MDEQEIDLRAILGVLKRRMRLIAAVVITVLVATGAVVFSLTPEYTASTLVMVDTSRKDLLDPAAMQGTSTAADNARVDSEVEIVKSVPTMLRVIENADLLNDPEFQPRIGMRQQLLAFFRIAEPSLPTGEEALNTLVTQLSNSVRVQRRGLTYLISISAESTSPQTAARIANAVADAYIASQLESKTQSILNSLDVLQPRIAEATAALAESESAYDRFIDDNLQRIVEDTGRQDIAALRADLTSATSEVSRLNSAVEVAARGLQSENYDEIANALQSQALANLEQQRTQLQARLGALADADAPEAVDLRAELGSLSAQLAATAEAEVAGLRREIASTQEEATTLRDNLRQSVLNGDLPPDVLTGIYELQQNSTLARANYERLVARVNDLNNQAAVQVADSRVVAPATAPNSPSFPNTRLILVLAALAALGLGAGLAFLVENYIGGFASPEQLEAVTRREVAATIPLQKAVKRPDGSMSSSAADAVMASPLSQFSESLRRLRLRIDQTTLRSESVAAGKAPVIVVTSAVPVEGKTTTAVGLARTYAAAGMRVLLIDGDLRKPSVHTQLDISPSEGLFDYLEGNLGNELPTSLVVRDPLSQVSVIVGARHSGVPTEQLLSSRTFMRLVEAGQAAFDVVILDTPPVGVVVDGMYVMQLADAVVFATRWGQTTQREVSRSLEAVDRSKRPEAPVLLALTQQPATGRRGVNRYYSYYSEA